MSLEDPHLLDALKVQVQIVSADQVTDAIAATLHYQMVYRVQNHALDLAIPGGEDALLIRVDEKNSACCTHVPRQICFSLLKTKLAKEDEFEGNSYLRFSSLLSRTSII